MKWLPRRFSVRALLLLTLGLSCLLAYRLQPLLEARKFVAAANSPNREQTLAMLPGVERQKARMWLMKGNSSTWKAQVTNTPWEALLTGECNVVIHVRWSRFSTYGSDELQVSFTTRRPPAVSITEGPRSVVPITII